MPIVVEEIGVSFRVLKEMGKGKFSSVRSLGCICLFLIMHLTDLSPVLHNLALFNACLWLLKKFD